MKLRLYPLDTLFFKDGKPFSFGEESWADGIFPFYPSVLYGTLRSAYFASRPDLLALAGGEDDPTMGLQVTAINFVVEKYPSNNSFQDAVMYFPLPRDCVVKKQHGNGREAILLKLEKNRAISNYPCECMLLPPDDSKVENKEGGLLRNELFQRYLNGTLPPVFNVSGFANHLISEPKIGIGRDNLTRTTEDGMLYRVDMKRLGTRHERASFIIDFTGLELQEKGFMKMGGEGKAVYFYQEKDGSKFATPNIPALDDNIFKVYLATPAIFKKGWLPEWIDKKTLMGSYRGLKVKLLAAAVGKYLPIGGFDMKKNRPKPMRRAVPAGSVYYFQLFEGDRSQLAAAFHNKSISDINPEQGFGLSFLGKVTK